MHEKRRKWFLPLKITQAKSGVMGDHLRGIGLVNDNSKSKIICTNKLGIAEGISGLSARTGRMRVHHLH